MPFLLALLALATTWHPKVLETHYVLLCERVTYPPLPSHTTVVVPFSLLVVRAGLLPLSPDASCSVAVSLSPRGATRLGGGYCPHPPAHLQSTVLQDLSACLCGAPFLPPRPLPLNAGAAVLVRSLLIVLLVPARPACSAGAEFI